MPSLLAPGQRARPPHPRAAVEHERGHEQRAHDECVEQDAEGDREAELGERLEWQRREHREGSREDDAGGGDDPAGDGEAAQHPLAGAVAQRFLPGPCHQEDVVVDAERDEEDEGQ